VAGGSLTYTIVVSNAGANPANNATFADSRPADISSWSWSCAATGSASCGATTSGTGNISVNDIDLPTGAGSNYLTYTINATVSGSASDPIINTATITAPAGTYDTNTGNNSASDTDTLQPDPGLTLTKSGVLDNTVVAPNDESDPNDTVTYSFSIQNTGNVTLNNIVVTDPLLSSLSCSITSLAVGATQSCTATNNVHTLTQTNIDAGKVDNTASADSDETDPTTDDESVNLTQAPGLTLTKTGVLNNTVVAPNDESDPNDTVTYSFSVENTGNVTLNNIVVTDPLLSSLSCSITSLAVGATQSCTATNNVHTLTQTNIDAGKVDNTASADSDETDPTTDDESVNLTQAPGLTLTKTGVLNNTIVAPNDESDPTMFTH